MNDEAKRDGNSGGSGDEAEVASPEELAAAARLRDLLEGGALPDIGATDEERLARALPHVFAPRDLEPEVHARLIADALAGRRRSARRGWRPAVIVTVSLGGVLAMAAAVLLVLAGSTRSASDAASVATTDPRPAEAAALVPRSAEPLFVNERQPLPHRGSARIDRIASARSGEYLQARLTRLGAR